MPRRTRAEIVEEIVESTVAKIEGLEKRIHTSRTLAEGDLLNCVNKAHLRRSAKMAKKLRSFLKFLDPSDLSNVRQLQVRAADAPGVVYLFRNARGCDYIGSTVHFRQRLIEHWDGCRSRFKKNQIKYKAKLFIFVIFIQSAQNFSKTCSKY